MARHASPTLAPYLIPCHYLTPDTRGYPLALLLEGDPGSPFPVAYGVTLDTGGTDSPCEECGGPNVSALAEVGEGSPVPYCMACLVGGDHFGLVPTAYLDLLPYGE